MAYNPRFLLNKIIEIQDIVKTLQQQGGARLSSGQYVVYTQKYIYENFIRDQFHISFSAFNRYLGRNAKKELADLNKKECIEA